MSSIYEPREDSELLKTSVEKFAKGRVLDLGTGSGIQAFTALKNPAVRSVLAIDINKKAVDFVAKKIAELGAHTHSHSAAQAGVEVRSVQSKPEIHVLQSDMFSAIPDELFDTIICNPPYLPDEENDSDPALYGGPQGYEWSIKFLTQAKNHLAPGGQILFLFSSLTNRDRVDLELKRLGYHHEELSMLADFFERLYVYRIWRSA